MGQSSSLSIPLPHQGKLSNFSTLQMLLAACFFAAFPPYPLLVFGKPQLISKPCVAAGGWGKGLIICFSAGVRGGEKREGRAPSPDAANLAHFCCTVPFPPPLPPPSPAQLPEPTMNPQAVLGYVFLLCFSFLSTAKGKKFLGCFGSWDTRGSRCPGMWDAHPGTQ